MHRIIYVLKQKREKLIKTIIISVVSKAEYVFCASVSSKNAIIGLFAFRRTEQNS